MVGVIALFVAAGALGALGASTQHRSAPWIIALIAFVTSATIGAYSAWGTYHDAPEWMVFAAATLYAATVFSVGAAIGWSSVRHLWRRAPG